MNKATQSLMAEKMGPEGQQARTDNGPERLPVIAIDLPVMYEDEGQDEMGETDIHWRCCEILRNGLIAHLAGQDKPFRVFSDLNVYYHPLDRGAYVSPDVCAVFPPTPLPLHVTSYRIGKDRPAPIICMEVMSHRSAQQQDLGNKLAIYADLGVLEYIVVDATGEFFPRQLLLKELVPEDRTWIDRQDRDGGVTSKLGFRVIIDTDGLVRVLNARTGNPYIRPEEVQAEVEARQQAEEARQQAEEARQQAQARIRQLEEELARLRREQNKK